MIKPMVDALRLDMRRIQYLVQYPRCTPGSAAPAARTATVRLCAWLFTLSSMGLVLAPPARAQDMLTTVPLHDLSAFRSTGANWHVAGDVFADLNRHHHLDTEAGTGVLVCIPTEDDDDHLFTIWEHGDLTLEMEFMMPAGSNSGVYLHGRYEVQLFDSWGIRDPGFGDVGGVYQRWDEDRQEGREGYGGVAPRVNAGRAPGLWQQLRIDFRAPRFDDEGRKTENARFDRVVLNGATVHENVELTGPTRAAAFEDEAPAGPLMIQGDHGPVALRRIRYKRYGTGSVRLSGLTYRIYEGEFAEMPDLDAYVPAHRGSLDGFRHDVVGDLETLAAIFDGSLSVPTSGPYHFELDLSWIDDDPHFEGNPTGGGFLRIGNDVVFEHPGTSPTGGGDIRLDAGSHSFTIGYFKNRRGREPEVQLSVEGPDTRRRLLNVAATLPSPQVADPILLDHEREPVLYRHMVDHGDARRTHAISVGDPLGIHYTLDLNRGSLLHAWRGPFLDATPMWHARGHHQLALPRGSTVTFSGEGALAPRPRAEAERPIEATYRFQGYELDDMGRPTFHYVVDGVGVSDRLEPVMEGRALRRRITANESNDLYHVVAASALIERLPNGTYAVDDRRYLIRLDQAPEPMLRSAGERYELFVPLSTRPVTYTILW